jgi:hypothetical protein
MKDDDEWDIKNADKISVGKPEYKRPLARRRRIWDNNIKMGLKINRLSGCEPS